MEESIRKVIIIGSGPAGLTAGLYTARANFKPLIISGPTPGGQLITTTDVENWPGEKKISGVQLMTKMRDHAKHAGCEFLSQSVQNIDTSKRPFTLTTDKGLTLQAETIIVATGARPRKLGIEGESTYWGKGVSTCAVCDGAFFKNKKLVVVGGGDTAMENASFLRRFTDDVTIIHIRDKFSASAPMQQRVLSDPAIKIIYNTTVTKLLGDDTHLQQAIITDQKTNQDKTITVDGLFVSIGMVPNTKFLQDNLTLTERGYIKVFKNIYNTTSTSVDGIFAAGDVFDHLYRQAITASGMGCMAALDVERYLRKQIK